MAPPRLDTNAAAAYTDRAPATLRWRRSMNLPPRSYSRGRRVFYDVVDLDRFLADEEARTERGVQ
jgi:hypothetical protein